MTAGETALITGASSGIGLHLAWEFAGRGHPLVLVAPGQDELNELAVQLTASAGVPVLPLSEDLEDLDAPDRLYQRLEEEEIDIDILVNNAGQGQRGRFWEVPLERHLSIVRLNVEAVIRMTALFLPLMIHRRRGRVLNTASIAGFEPGPMLAVYHASKAFVLSWSEALSAETEGTEVTVTALCPGPTDTDFFAHAHLADTRAFQEASRMASQDAARAGYEGLMKGASLVVSDDCKHSRDGNKAEAQG